MTSMRTLLATAAISLPLAVCAEGGSPWLPIPGEASISLNHTQQSGKNAYVGSMQLPVSAITMGGADKFERTTTTLRLGYGLTDALAVDLALGRGRVKVGAADNDKGSVDTVLGLSWRVLDEFEQPDLPTVTLRGAAILKGSYEGARLAALGNDQNGVELAALLGKQFAGGFSVWGELGLQNRSGAVPNATFFELGGRFRFAPGLSASLAYASKKYGGDLDIGGAGFSPARFQEVKDERALVKFGLSYAFASNQGVALNLAKVTSGRNTVKDDRIVGLSYTFAF